MPYKPGFGGRISYARFEKNSVRQRDDWTVLRNLDGVDPDHAQVVMSATAKQNRRVKDPCGHMVLSWAHNDPIDDASMVDQTDRAMHDLGLSEHQAMYVAHNDTDHRHIHVIYNRIHPDTHKAAKDSFSRKRLRQSCMQIELEFGLTQTPEKTKGRHDRPLFSEIEIARRNGQEPSVRMPKKRCDRLREELDYCFKSAMGWSSFHDMLKRRGYDLSQAGPGVRIVRHHRYAKLSDVTPPKLSAKKLTQKWGKFSDYWKEMEKPKTKQKESLKQRQK